MIHSVVILRTDTGLWRPYCITEHRDLGDVATIAAAYEVRRTHEDAALREVA